MKKLAFYLVYGIIRLFGILPLAVLKAFSSGCYFLMYYVIRYRRQVTFDNIRQAFPAKTEKEVKDIAKKFYAHLCDIFIELFSFYKLPEKTILKRMRFSNPEILEKFAQQNKSIIVLTSHYGNWETPGQIAKQFGYDALGVYKPLSNQLSDWVIRKIRSSKNGIPIAMQDVMRKMVEYKKSGKLFLLYLIADQRPMLHPENFWLSFMGRMIPVIDGPEKLARRFNMPVVFLDIRPQQRGYYKIYITCLSDNPQNLADHQLTKMYFQKLETCINEQPEYYLWSHKRWKYTR